jgi:hypothetical protein
LETGGALKSVRKDENGWWTCDSPVGKAEIKISQNNRVLGILDHIAFILLPVYMVIGSKA